MPAKSSRLKLIFTSSVLFLILFILYILAFNNSGTVLSATTGHVVISEVQIAGDGGADDEFVELYNPTGSDVTMTGWRLTRKNSSGTEANLVSSLNGTIPSHGYFLITDADGYNSAATADANYSATSNQMTNNYSVLLYSDAGTTLIDKVGFGTAPDFEGSVFSQNPASDGSIERNPGANSPTGGNGEDTDNNSIDFTLRTISEPQNTVSATEDPLDITPTETVTLTLTPTQEITPTVENSPTPTPSPEPSPTIEPSPTVIPTPSPTETPIPTATPEVTPTIDVTPTPGLTPTPIAQENVLGIFKFPGITKVCTLTFQKHTFFFSFFYFPQIRCN